MKELEEAIETLEIHDKWQRGFIVEKIDSRSLDIAVDVLIKYIDHLVGCGIEYSDLVEEGIVGKNNI